IARAMISAGPNVGARTGPDGSFQLAGLPPGRTSVRIQAPGGLSVSKWVDVEAGGEFGSDLVVGGGSRIAGRVVDSEGDALAGCWVELLALPRGAGVAQE